LSGPGTAAADHLLGGVAARGAKHPLDRYRPVVVRARHRGRDRGDRAELPWRRLARRVRPVQQMSARIVIPAQSRNPATFVERLWVPALVNYGLHWIRGLAHVAGTTSLK